MSKGRHVWANQEIERLRAETVRLGDEAVSIKRDLIQAKKELITKDAIIAEYKATLGETEDRFSWALNRIDELNVKITELELYRKRVVEMEERHKALVEYLRDEHHHNWQGVMPDA